MTNRLRTIASIAIAIALIGTAGAALGHTLDEKDSIPRCSSDDFNSTSLPQCYLVTVDGKFIVLDQNDEVIS